MMKINNWIFPLLLLIVLLAACSNNAKVFDLASISQLFEEAELHLKPQAEDDGYPSIGGIKPNVYELLDDSLYIYVFESADDLTETLEEINVEELFHAPPYVYQLNNILILYIPLSPSDVNFEKQIREIIDTAHAQK